MRRACTVGAPSKTAVDKRFSPCPEFTNKGLNLVANQPIYLYGSQYPGTRAVNKAAFAVPSTGVNGNAPRNFVRGFGEAQVNAYSKASMMRRRISMASSMLF
jgi:hypothetical protein